MGGIWVIWGIPIIWQLGHPLSVWNTGVLKGKLHALSAWSLYTYICRGENMLCVEYQEFINKKHWLLCWPYNKIMLSMISVLYIKVLYMYLMISLPEHLWIGFISLILSMVKIRDFSFIPWKITSNYKNTCTIERDYFIHVRV